MKNHTTIQMDGRQVGLKFGLPAVRQIFDKTIKQKLEDADGNYGPHGMAHVLHAGYCNNCLVKQVDEDLTFEDFADFVDEQYVLGNLDKIIDAVNVFTNSTIVKGLAETAKKKIATPEQSMVTKEESQSPSIGTESNLSVTDSLD